MPNSVYQIDNHYQIDIHKSFENLVDRTETWFNSNHKFLEVKLDNRDIDCILFFKNLIALNT